jgi:hypothetical protein
MSSREQSCRHHDIQVFNDFRCCLACGETVFNQLSKEDRKNECETSIWYRYRRLNYELGQEVRLLILYPAEDGENLTSDIVHVNLADKPVYEALSYTWSTQEGDSSMSQSIRNRETGEMIAITKNCDAALRCLRRKGRKRVLWVDAISIDQADVSERSHQVKFMSTIYSSASQVLMFLGHRSQSTDNVMDFINTGQQPLVWKRTEKMILDVQKFLRCHYFDRIWILQEIALARLITLVIGDKTARWTASTIKELQDLPRGRMQLPSALQWYPASEPETDLLQVLCKSRNCSATDPRDKVYAVLGLVQQDGKKDLVVDYSLDPQQVYLSVAKHIISQYRCLKVLKYAPNKLSRSSVNLLPSWVPAWDSKSGYEPLPPQYSASEMQVFSQSWYRPPALHDRYLIRKFEEALSCGVLDNGLESEITRSTVDWYEHISNRFRRQDLNANVELLDLSLYISYIGDRHFHHDICKDNILRVRAHYLDTVSTRYPLGTLDGPFSPPKASSFKFVTDIRCPSCHTHIALGLHSKCYMDFWSATSDQREIYSKLEDGVDSDPGIQFTTKHSVGFSPSSLVLQGDSICMIDGVDVPLIFRKDHDRYKLVGECYLYQAAKNLQCGCCGNDAQPWPVVTQIIDLF